MSKRILGGALAGMIALGAFQIQPALAAPTSQQRIKAKVAENALKKAQSLNDAKKYKEAGESLKQAQGAIAELGSDAEAGKLLAPLYKHLANLHGDLELQGVKLEALPPEPQVVAAEPAKPALGKPAAGKPIVGKPIAGKPTAGKPAAKPGAIAAALAASGATSDVSFSKEVAPMLVEKCGKCHIASGKGDFKFASYSELMKAKDGNLISPKDGAASRIVDVISTGDMPRGGGKVAPEALAALTKWIDQGAKFDGDDPDLKIVDPKFTNLNKGKKDKNREVMVTMATGKESISFAGDIAPVLVAECVSCHAGRKPKGKFDVGDFKSMVKGGDSGEPYFPGKPAQSLLIQKINGTAKDGARMPPKGKPLSPDVIAKFEKWISEGATYDGSNSQEDVKDVAALAHAERITPDQLSKERAELGAHNWKLILPDGGADRAETENFLVFGNTGKASLQETAKIAEEQGAKLQKLLKLPTGPLIKGRTTIYVFDKKYDYSEVGRMLESRAIPAESHGHWAYTIIDSYICIVPPKSNEYSLKALIGQQVAGVMVAGQGKVPHWFAEGSSRNLTSKLDPKDTRCQQWDSQAAEALGSGSKATAFLNGSGPENDAIAYAFVKQLMSDTARYHKVLDAVRAKAPFDSAFAKAYGAEPGRAVAMWSGR